MKSGGINKGKQVLFHLPPSSLLQCCTPSPPGIVEESFLSLELSLGAYIYLLQALLVASVSLSLEVTLCCFPVCFLFDLNPV